MTEPGQDSIGTHRLTQMQRGMPMWRFVGAILGLALFLGIAAIGFVVERERGSGAAVWLGLTVLVLAVGGGGLLGWDRPRPGAVWDLDSRTIHWRNRITSFRQVHQVRVVPGSWGYHWVHLVTDNGPVHLLAINVEDRRNRRPEVWFGIRELLNSPHQPALVGHTIGANPTASGPDAVEILDRQVAWVARGGNLAGSPIEQFRVNR